MQGRADVDRLQVNPQLRCHCKVMCSWDIVTGAMADLDLMNEGICLNRAAEYTKEKAKAVGV